MKTIHDLIEATLYPEIVPTYYKYVIVQTKTSKVLHEGSVEHPEIIFPAHLIGAVVDIKIISENMIPQSIDDFHIFPGSKIRFPVIEDRNYFPEGMYQVEVYSGYIKSKPDWYTHITNLNDCVELPYRFTGEIHIVWRDTSNRVVARQTTFVPLAAEQYQFKMPTKDEIKEM